MDNLAKKCGPQSEVWAEMLWTSSLVLGKQTG